MLPAAMSGEDLVHRIREAAGEPEGALVLLHGRATDENDLYPLLDAFDPERRLAGATIRGPLTLPPGGYHWYAVREIGYPDPETFWQTLPHLASFLDRLADELGVGLGRTVIGGFSQGAVMSHALALAEDRPRPAGVLAMSGFIPTVEELEVDLEAAAGLPVFVAHGSHDPVIGVEWGRDARDRLTAAGADLTYRETPIPHGVDPAVVPDIRDWLASAVE